MSTACASPMLSKTINSFQINISFSLSCCFVTWGTRSSYRCLCVHRLHTVSLYEEREAKNFKILISQVWEPWVLETLAIVKFVN